MTTTPEPFGHDSEGRPIPANVPRTVVPERLPPGVTVVAPPAPMTTDTWAEAMQQAGPNAGVLTERVADGAKR